jgi:hypothetical protein
MKDVIQDAIHDAIEENPSEMQDKINAVLGAKVQDAMLTKKMEISNKWLNDIEPPSEEED